MPKRPPFFSSSLSPSFKKHPRTNPRIHLVTCPICHTRMSLLLVDSHIDRCKPRPSPQFPSSQATPTKPSPTKPSAPHPTLSQSHLKPLPLPPTLHFVFSPPTPSSPPSASFSSSPCCKCPSPYFTSQVSLRNHPTVPKTPLLILHQCTANISFPIPSLPPNCPGSLCPPSILLSALQKSIRRRLCYPAVRIAAAIIRKLGLFELLRRFTVIILEDAVLYPWYASLVWLMSAVSKGYTVCLEGLRWVLGAVWEVAEVGARDMGVWEEVEWVVKDREGDLVEGVKIRGCYGGMEGDVALFKRAGRVWGVRLSEQKEEWGKYLGMLYGGRKWEGSVEKLMVEGEGVIRVGDVPLASFDMHCCGVVQEVVAGGVGKEVMERFGEGGLIRGVEGLMWRFRSSVSMKRGFQELEEALEGIEGGGENGNVCADEVLWKFELEGVVNEWCRNYRKRYGL